MPAECGVATARRGQGCIACTAKTLLKLLNFCSGLRLASKAVGWLIVSFVAVNTRYNYCVTELFGLLFAVNSVINLILNQLYSLAKCFTCFLCFVNQIIYVELKKIKII